MNNKTWWSEPTDPDTVARRAAGRRHYNSVRTLLATLRRHEVADLLLAGVSQSEIARRLGVHRSTICRDVLALCEQAQRTERCPVCGQTYRADLVGL